MLRGDKSEIVTLSVDELRPDPQALKSRLWFSGVVVSRARSPPARARSGLPSASARRTLG